MATDIQAQKNVTVTEDWRKKVVIDRERKGEILPGSEKIEISFKY